MNRQCTEVATQFMQAFVEHGEVLKRNTGYRLFSHSSYKPNFQAFQGWKAFSSDFLIYYTLSCLWNFSIDLLKKFLNLRK